MEESAGLDLGSKNLAELALQSSTALDELIESLGIVNSHADRLQLELGELRGVLTALIETTDATEFDFSALNTPLLQCGRACKEVEQDIRKCLSQPGNHKRWLRDLRYMDENTDGFAHLLVIYKDTITIALETETLCDYLPSLDTEVREGYKRLARKAVTNLEEHIEILDEKLKDQTGETVLSSGQDSKRFQTIREEQISAQRCFEICSKFLECIGQVQLPLERSDSDKEFDREVLKAKTYGRRDISTFDNYALGDAVQTTTSFDSKRVFHSRNRGFGWRTRQYNGYYEGATLRKLSGDHAFVLPTQTSGGRAVQGRSRAHRISKPTKY